MGGSRHIPSGDTSTDHLGHLAGSTALGNGRMLQIPCCFLRGWYTADPKDGDAQPGICLGKWLLPVIVISDSALLGKTEKANSLKLSLCAQRFEKKAGNSGFILASLGSHFVALATFLKLLLS